MFSKRRRKKKKKLPGEGEIENCLPLTCDRFQSMTIYRSIPKQLPHSGDKIECNLKMPQGAHLLQ